MDENPSSSINDDVIEGLISLSKKKSNVTDIDKSSTSLSRKDCDETVGTSNEALDDFNVHGNLTDVAKTEEEFGSSCKYKLNKIGDKNCTGGWFVSEGDVLLAYADGSCSFYDIINSEEKIYYKAPGGLSPNLWQDCWIVCAPGGDGSSGKFVLAASAGKASESGFCSWDFYSNEIQAYVTMDDSTGITKRNFAPSNKKHSKSYFSASESSKWWYKPCGPLIISAGTCKRGVKVYDIRDGERVMKWELEKPVLAMEYSSPLQWRSRGKVVVAEAEGISYWDLSSLKPSVLQSISSNGRTISALHVTNSDAEPGGGVRQRGTSSGADDGVFCTAEAINILDFRNPSGIGFKIPKLGAPIQSLFASGDSIYLGCKNSNSTAKNPPCYLIQQEISIRQQKICNTYIMSESNIISNYADVKQVWGNSNVVMGVCEMGLFVFDAPKERYPAGMAGKDKVVIGPNNMYSPSFDYSGSRVLLISTDRPAQWSYLS